MGEIEALDRKTREALAAGAGGWWLVFRFIRDTKYLHSVLRGEIKFTPVRGLNDPAELVPRFEPERILESLHALRRRGCSASDLAHFKHQDALLSRLCPAYKLVSAPGSKEQADILLKSTIYENWEYMERMLLGVSEEIALRVGVACFSTRFDSLPMWAHYAGNAHGFCVEYCDLDQVFVGDDTGVLNAVLPVSYSDDQVGVTYDPESYVRLFTSKFGDWRYEDERRVVLPLDELRRDGAHHFYDVPSKHVRRIILGWNTRAELITDLKSQAESLCPGAVIDVAFPHRGMITLNN